MNTAAALDDLTFLDDGAEPAPSEALAVALMRSTDGAVAASAVPGTHPPIASAAARCVAAYHRGDFAEVVRACHEILRVVRLGTRSAR